MGLLTLHDCFEGVYPISQVFGHNFIDPVTKKSYYPQFNFKGHEGVDFATPTGTAAISATPGRVLHAGFEAPWAAYGNFVEVWDYNQKLACLYGHLKSVSVKVGQEVGLGQKLGITDATTMPGRSVAPHLHFGVCATDGLGNRLNRANGYGGWLNSLDKSQFTWILGVRTPAVPPVSPIKIPPVAPPPPKATPVHPGGIVWGAATKTVTKIGARVRENYSLTAKILRTVPKGTRLVLDGHIDTASGRWWHLSARSGYGWMSQAVLS